jgi:branched-chain amino acid transport system ATP-binding protein
VGDVLDVRGVHVHFGGVRAVDGVDLAVAPGEIVGIIGPNGAGKTRLLDAICGHAPLTGGEVWFDGRRVDEVLPYRRARLGIGRSFQDARLFPSMTVREVLLGALHPSFTSGFVAEALHLPWARTEERDARRRVEELLELVDLHHYLDHQVSQLSFGTTRAVELVWLAARRPALLLLDEPASGLQQSEVRALGGLVDRVRDGAAVVVIDHDVPFVAGLAHRLVAMDLGKVVAAGGPDEVLHHPEVLRSYLGTKT